MIVEMAGYIFGGTAVTLAVTIIALPMGLLIGTFLALLRVYGGNIISGLTAAYSNTMRGVPPIVLLFILYFIIAGSINLSPFWAGSLALGIISSAYQLEIVRGAIQSVGNGQMMAARAVGMSPRISIRHIILPQAFRLAIPGWCNEASTVLKDSSLVYALGVTEILRRSQFVGARTHKPLLAFLAAAVIYFVLVFLTNRIIDFVERRTKIPDQV